MGHITLVGPGLNPQYTRTDDDIEDGVPDREQVDSEREEVDSERESRERQTRRDNKRTLKRVTSWMACGWSEMRTETP